MGLQLKQSPSGPTSVAASVAPPPLPPTIEALQTPTFVTANCSALICRTEHLKVLDQTIFGPICCCVPPHATGMSFVSIGNGSIHRLSEQRTTG